MDRFAHPAVEQPVEVVGRKAGDAGQGVQVLVPGGEETVQIRVFGELGAFLSGGIDSSTIVAVMQSLSTQPVRTFSIGFNEDGYNEAAHAKVVAAHLGTRHTELYVSSQEARDVIPRLPQIYSEPFSDSSQIPTFLVAQMARREVAVSLSGDAGDELFSGYTRYAFAEGPWKKLVKIPRVLRRGAAAGLTALPPCLWDCLLSFKDKKVGDKLHKLAGVLDAKDDEALYRAFISHWTHPSDLVLESQEPPTALDGLCVVPDFKNASQRMQYLDLISYLPDDILVKVDRAAMAVSLETRVPFLDHRLVEFALSLPLTITRREGLSKAPLRQLLYSYVPREIVARPKMGFGIPLDTWLRGPLREWGEDLLSASRLNQDGFFNVAAVRKKWDEHQSGARNWQYALWDVLMFQAWKGRNA